MESSSSPTSCFSTSSVSRELRYSIYGVWTCALLLSTISSIALLFILNKIKFQNSYNLLVYLMTITSLTFDVCTIIYCCLIYNLDDLFVIILTLDVLRSIVHIIFYFLSAVLSYTSYRLLVYKRTLRDSLRSDPKFKGVLLCIISILAVAILGYLIATIHEQVTARKDLESHDAKIGNFVNILILFVFSMYSFLTYFYCKYLARDLFMVMLNTNNQSSAEPNPSSRFPSTQPSQVDLIRARNLENTLRHIQKYPFLQCLAIIPVQILNFSCNNYSSFGYLNYKPIYFALHVIFELLFYLNSFLMVLVFIYMNPKSNFVKKLKSSLFCLKSSNSKNSFLMSEGSEIKDEGASRIADHDGGGDDVFIPSDYRPDNSFSSEMVSISHSNNSTDIRDSIANPMNSNMDNSTSWRVDDDGDDDDKTKSHTSI